MSEQYYVKVFDEGGFESILSDSAPSPDYHAVGDSIDGKFFIKELNSIRVMTKQEYDSYMHTLENNSALSAIRDTRDILLKESDWTQSIADNPLSPAMQQAWAEYREALRNFPETVSDPLNPDWPVPPA